MKKNTKFKKQITTLTILLMIFLSSFLMIFPMNNFDSGADLKNKNNNDIDTEIESIDIDNNPKLSIVGNDTWWDINWRFRQLIVITNENPTGLENYPVKITFNYSKLVDDGYMNSTCKDIRIVEGGALRKYYFLRDYPAPELVTVWFDTTIASGPGTTEYDTYLYYGNLDIEINTDYFMNESSSDSADAFSWIRNGDFELIDPPGDNLFQTEFFGWKWSDQPPTDLKPGGSGSGTESFVHGLIDTALGQERVYGNFTYKWGTSHEIVDDSKFPGGGYSFDFEGRLYSYPFITPKVDADKKLYINLFRNIRVYNEKPQAAMTFFVRISNATRNYDNPGSSADSVEYFQEYKMEDKNLPFTEMQRDPVDPKGYGTTLVDTRNEIVDPPTGVPDGELTGMVSNTFEIPAAWQGQPVFLEIGMYGVEDKFKMAFGQVDNVSYNYKLDIDLQDDVQEVQSEINIITKDVYGRIVPYANVSLVDITKTPSILRSEVTDSTGSALFSNIGYGTYNFTVEYTLNTGQKGVVYDSTKPGEKNYTISEEQSIYEFVLILNMSTLDFEITDWVGRPLNYGFVNIKTSETGSSLENRTLDSRGTTTFRWFNVSSYYYEIYYNNTDYADNPIKLNESYVYRSDYLAAIEKTQTFKVNETNLTPGPEYLVEQYVYTNGSSTELGNKKIINFTVTLENMDNFLDNVTIYYVDRTNSTDGNLIFTDTSYGPTDNSDTISITIRDPPEYCDNLATDNYDAYGLLIIVKGTNNTVKCNGTITVELVETWNEFNRTALARMNIQVVSGLNPIDVATVHVETGPPNRKSIINLTSYVIPLLGLDSDGWCYGRINYLIPFWYIIGGSYNLSVTISSVLVDFEVNTTLNDQWGEDYFVSAGNTYNLTMTYDDGTVILDTNVVAAQIQTRFTNMTITEEVDWGDTIYVQVYYEFTIGVGGWNPITDSSNVMIKFSTMGADSKTYITAPMSNTGGGNYIYNADSSLLTAGVSSKSYVVIISADESEYVDPADAVNYTIVNARETDYTIHDGYPDFVEGVEFSQYFGELINISIMYIDNETKTAIKDAKVFYDWLNLGDKQFYADEVNDSYYTVSLNTSLAGSVGLKSIKLTVYKENYTIKQNILIELRILERPTSINNQTGFYYISKSVWVKDPYNFTFGYRDYLTKNLISELDVHEYTWQKTDAQGNPISGQEGVGTLIKRGDKKYVLDFDTEKKSIGYYLLYLAIQKDNYELRTAVINLVVKIRIFDADLDATNLDDEIITVVHGKKIEFEVSLIDKTRGNIPLTGADVTIEIDNKEYDMDEDEPGVYKYTYDTDDVEAFYTSKTLSCTITIEKVDFDSDEIEVTIVVEMEEIFPGMPTFYFILILAAIIGIVGAIAGYRIIQQARIPKFVKNIRKVKKSIKSRSSVPSIPIPTKNKMFLKELGKEWSQLGISLKDTLGIKEIESPNLGKAKDKLRKKGGAK